MQPEERGLPSSTVTLSLCTTTLSQCQLACPPARMHVQAAGSLLSAAATIIMVGSPHTNTHRTHQASCCCQQVQTLLATLPQSQQLLLPTVSTFCPEDSTASQQERCQVLPSCVISHKSCKSVNCRGTFCMPHSQQQLTGRHCNKRWLQGDRPRWSCNTTGGREFSKGLCVCCGTQ